MTHKEYLLKNLNKKDLYGYPANPARNPYVSLTENFRAYSNGDYKDKDEDDLGFYDWLNNLFDNNEIDKSYVLSLLLKREFNNDAELLRKFVFNPYDEERKLISQKWHFYISWYTLREYWGTIGRRRGIVNWEYPADLVFEEKINSCKELVEWLRS